MTAAETRKRLQALRHSESSRMWRDFLTYEADAWTEKMVAATDHETMLRAQGAVRALREAVRKVSFDSA